MGPDGEGDVGEALGLEWLDGEEEINSAPGLKVMDG